MLCTTPLPPDPVLLHVPLPRRGLECTNQLLADVSTSVKQLEGVYLQRMRAKGVEWVALWTEEHVCDTHWGDHNSLIFELSDHTTRQHLLHHLGTLHKETAVCAVAELSATANAACTGLQMAARQAGIHHRLISANLLLLLHTTNRVHGIMLRLDDQRGPQVAAHLGSWVACRPNDWHWQPVSTLAKAPR